MARYGTNKSSSGQHNATSQPSITRKKNTNHLRTAAKAFGKGSRGKDLRLISQVFPSSLSPSTSKEVDEDSGLGNDAMPSDPISSSSLFLAPTPVTTIKKTASAPMLLSHDTECVTKRQIELLHSHSEKVSPTIPSFINSHSVASNLPKSSFTSTKTPSLSTYRRLLTTSHNLGVQVKRRFNTLAGKQMSNSPSQSLEVEFQRPPAKRQATMKKLNPVKRLTISKPPQITKTKQGLRGPSVVHFSDEATQELPGQIFTIEQKAQMMNKGELPQLLTFSDITSSGLTRPSALSTSTSVASLRCDMVNTSDLKAEASSYSTSFVDNENSSTKSLFVSIISNLNHSNNELKEEKEDLVGLMPTFTQRESVPCQMAEQDISNHAITSSGLTNMCDDMSLSHRNELQATDFHAFKGILIAEDPLGEAETTEVLPMQKSNGNPVDVVQSLIIKKEEIGEDVHVINGIEEFGDKSDSTLPEVVAPLPISLNESLRSVTSDGKIKLVLVKQPEKQHRARYGSEGSRGAVKDEEGTGHPIVEIQGCNVACTMQVFVASESGKVSPHLCYQACQVTSRTVETVSEVTIEKTKVITLAVTPEMDMRLSCDCVGILKERFTDIEKKSMSLSLPKASGRKRAPTKCRMVFRATVRTEQGQVETIQIASQPISCTQPPGVPDISRKSLSKCGVSEQPDLFIIGKHFQRDSKVVFESKTTESNKFGTVWKQTVVPDTDVYSNTHLVCKVPKFDGTIPSDRVIDVTIRVLSAGKYSEPQDFTFEPDDKHFSTYDFNDSSTTTKRPLPDGISEDAVRVNENYTATGKFVPFSKDSSRKSVNSKSNIVTDLLVKMVPLLECMTEQKLQIVERAVKGINASTDVKLLESLLNRDEHAAMECDIPLKEKDSKLTEFGNMLRNCKASDNFNKTDIGLTNNKGLSSIPRTMPTLLPINTIDRDAVNGNKMNETRLANLNLSSYVESNNIPEVAKVCSLLKGELSDLSSFTTVSDDGSRVCHRILQKENAKNVQTKLLPSNNEHSSVGIDFHVTNGELTPVTVKSEVESSKTSLSSFDCYEVESSNLQSSEYRDVQKYLGPNEKYIGDNNVVQCTASNRMKTEIGNISSDFATPNSNVDQRMEASISDNSVSSSNVQSLIEPFCDATTSTKKSSARSSPEFSSNNLLMNAIKETDFTRSSKSSSCFSEQVEAISDAKVLFPSMNCHSSNISPNRLFSHHNSPAQSFQINNKEEKSLNPLFSNCTDAMKTVRVNSNFNNNNEPSSISGFLDQFNESNSTFSNNTGSSSELQSNTVPVKSSQIIENYNSAPQQNVLDRKINLEISGRSNNTALIQQYNQGIGMIESALKGSIIQNKPEQVNALVNHSNQVDSMRNQSGQNNFLEKHVNPISLLQNDSNQVPLIQNQSIQVPLTQNQLLQVSQLQSQSNQVPLSQNQPSLVSVMQSTSNQVSVLHNQPNQLSLLHNQVPIMQNQSSAPVIQVKTNQVSTYQNPPNQVPMILDQSNPVSVMTNQINHLAIMQNQTNQVQALQNQTNQVQAMQMQSNQVQTMQNNSNQVPAMQNQTNQVQALQNNSNQVQAMQNQTNLVQALQMQSNQVITMHNQINQVQPMQNPINQVQTMQNPINQVQISQNQSNQVQAMQSQINRLPLLQNQCNQLHMIQDKPLIGSSLHNQTDQSTQMVHDINRDQVISNQSSFAPAQSQSEQMSDLLDQTNQVSVNQNQSNSMPLIIGESTKKIDTWESPNMDSTSSNNQCYRTNQCTEISNQPMATEAILNQSFVNSATQNLATLNQFNQTTVSVNSDNSIMAANQHNQESIKLNQCKQISTERALLLQNNPESTMQLETNQNSVFNESNGNAEALYHTDKITKPNEITRSSPNRAVVNHLSNQVQTYNDPLFTNNTVNGEIRNASPQVVTEMKSDECLSINNRIDFNNKDYIQNISSQNSVTTPYYSFVIANQNNVSLSSETGFTSRNTNHPSMTRPNSTVKYVLNDANFITQDSHNGQNIKVSALTSTSQNMHSELKPDQKLIMFVQRNPTPSSIAPHSANNLNYSQINSNSAASSIYSNDTNSTTTDQSPSILTNSSCSSYVMDENPSISATAVQSGRYGQEFHVGRGNSKDSYSQKQSEEMYSEQLVSACDLDKSQYDTLQQSSSSAMDQSIHGASLEMTRQPDAKYDASTARKQSLVLSHSSPQMETDINSDSYDKSNVLLGSCDPLLSQCNSSLDSWKKY